MCRQDRKVLVNLRGVLPVTLDVLAETVVVVVFNELLFKAPTMWMMARVMKNTQMKTFRVKTIIWQALVPTIKMKIIKKKFQIKKLTSRMDMKKKKSTMVKTSGDSRCDKLMFSWGRT